MMSNYQALDEALETSRDAGPELSNGLTNHAPMAIEALCAMGRADAVASWFDGYRPGLIARPPAIARLSDRNWHEALGHLQRFTDWKEFIAQELRDADWQRVVDRWVERLAPGISAAATHGVLRTGHAVRALTESETAPRLGELADGLAYWAATYQTLPTRNSDPQALAPLAALSRVSRLPAAQRTFAGTITSALAPLATSPDFADAISLLAIEGDVAELLSNLTETFARAYLTNAHDVLSAIVFIHSVTSVAAVRSLVPHLRPVPTRSALRYIWQSGCALYAAFGIAEPQSRAIAPCVDSSATLIDRAVAHGDEHVIKFTEACLREDAIRPHPVYRIAAARAAATLPPSD